MHYFCLNCCRILLRHHPVLRKLSRTVSTSRNFNFKLKLDEAPLSDPQRGPRTFFYRSAIAKLHKKDKMPPQRWRLIYSLPGLEWLLRAQTAVFIYFPLFCFVDAYFLNGSFLYMDADVWWMYITVHKMYLCLPIVIFITAATAWIRHLSILRIYEDLEKENSFIGIYQSHVGLNRKIPFKGTDIEVLSAFHEPPKYRIFMPNLKIRNRFTYVNQNFNFRSDGDLRKILSVKSRFKTHEDPDEAGVMRDWSSTYDRLKKEKRRRFEASQKIKK